MPGNQSAASSVNGAAPGARRESESEPEKEKDSKKREGEEGTDGAKQPEPKRRRIQPTLVRSIEGGDAGGPPPPPPPSAGV